MHFAAQSNPIGNVGSELKQRLHPRQLLATKQSVAALHCLLSGILGRAEPELSVGSDGLIFDATGCVELALSVSSGCLVHDAADSTKRIDVLRAFHCIAASGYTCNSKIVQSFTDRRRSPSQLQRRFW